MANELLTSAAAERNKDPILTVLESVLPPSGSVLEINYQIKSTNRGEFTVPPIFAEAMYERSIKGRGVGGKISVIE